MKALSLTNQKIWPMKKKIADKHTDKRTNGPTEKRKGQNYMPPDPSMRGYKKNKNEFKFARKCFNYIGTKVLYYHWKFVFSNIDVS